MVAEPQRQYTIAFNENNQEIVLSGSLRPHDGRDLNADLHSIRLAVASLRGTLNFNCKRLEYMSEHAFHALLELVSGVLHDQPDLRIRLIISSFIAWSAPKLQWLSALHAGRVIVERYDDDFYPGQAVIENLNFIPVLRTQTQIIWRQEQHLLPRHGLRGDLKIADVCCGIGDFAVLVHKAFKPRELVCVDHSKAYLTYARSVLQEYGLVDIDYRMGDAGNLLLPDGHFDFVSSRLSLQIFDKPGQILRELVRVCAPGGRVYLTNETYSKTFGYPRSESISWAYQEASQLFLQKGMDLEFGIKMRRYMLEVGLEDVRIEPLIITTDNTPSEEFVAVVESWRDYIVNDLAEANDYPADKRERLRLGFEHHIEAIRHPRGFAGWMIWAGSGRKPWRSATPGNQE